MPDVAELSDHGRRSSWELPGAVEVLAAVKAALARFGLTIGETPEGTMRSRRRP